MAFNIVHNLSNNIVNKAFNQYIAAGGKPVKFTGYLSEILHIQADTISRKLSGAKVFSVEELELIGSHFHIDLIQQAELPTHDFVFNPLGPNEAYFMAYFEGIILKLQYIHACKQQKMKLICEDLPIFYYFEHSHLAACKLYFYKNTLYPQKTPLNAAYVAQCGVEKLKPIAELYNQIPSEELWGYRTIDSTIFQLVYLADTQKLTDKALMGEILAELLELIETVSNNADAESKNGQEKNLVMYKSDITIGNNLVYCQTDLFKTCFVNINTFNSIQLFNRDHLADVELWMHTMFKSGIKISGDGTSQRSSLLKVYTDKIELLKQYLLVHDMNAKTKLMGL
jgi:hypothetical protein